MKPDVSPLELDCPTCGVDILPRCPHADHRQCECICHALRHEIAKQNTELDRLRAERDHWKVEAEANRDAWKKRDQDASNSFNREQALHLLLKDAYKRIAELEAERDELQQNFVNMEKAAYHYNQALQIAKSEIERLNQELVESQRAGQQAAESYQSIGEEMFKVSKENDLLTVRVSQLEQELADHDQQSQYVEYIRKLEAEMKAKSRWWQLSLNEGTKSPEPGRDLKIWRTCIECDQRVEIRVHGADYDKWRRGGLIQQVMPYLSAGEREILISGICGTCFDKLIPEPED